MLGFFCNSLLDNGNILPAFQTQSQDFVCSNQTKCIYTRRLLPIPFFFPFFTSYKTFQNYFDKNDSAGREDPDADFKSKKVYSNNAQGRTQDAAEPDYQKLNCGKNNETRL